MQDTPRPARTPISILAAALDGPSCSAVFAHGAKDDGGITSIPGPLVSNLTPSFSSAKVRGVTAPPRFRLMSSAGVLPRHATRRLRCEIDLSPGKLSYFTGLPVRLRRARAALSMRP